MEDERVVTQANRTVLRNVQEEADSEAQRLTIPWMKAYKQSRGS